VFYIDPVLFPFDNAALAARNPDQAAFMPNQTKLVRRFMQQAGLKDLPPTLADYLAFVTRVLEDHQRPRRDCGEVRDRLLSLVRLRRSAAGCRQRGLRQIPGGRRAVAH
jgi:hypothetical protein